ncbi:MAG: hypothetical protein ACRDXF_01025, partial [Acidimicrobiia bacterium]
MTHDQIREMVRRVNPIPDSSVFEIVDVPVLTTPLERRTEMQIDDRPGTEVPADRNRRRGPLVGIATTAVILIAGLVFIQTRDDTPVAEPAPNATRISPDEMDSPLAPGAYFVDIDGDGASSVGGTFVIEDSGWASLPAGARKEFGEDFVSLLVVQVDEVWSPACGGGEPLAAGSTAEALANQVAAAGFTIREALAPVTAFGHDGHHLAVETTGCVGDQSPVWQGPTFGRFYQAPGQVVDYWFLDVEGTPVMVEA